MEGHKYHIEFALKKKSTIEGETINRDLQNGRDVEKLMELTEKRILFIKISNE